MQIRDRATGAFVSSSYDGTGWLTVDITNALQATSDWHGNHTIHIECGSGRGTVFMQLLGRVTIQPIRVSD
jgi:hypothetical protein